MGGFAWVTLATNDSYSLGALVLAHSLKRVNTAHQLAILITPGVTEAMRTQLSAVFNVVKEVDVLDSRDTANLALLARPELGITFTKLHCWRLTHYDKCVFLDADTLVLQNCDELFDREELSAAPDVGWPDCFNSGVFVYKPSDETFKAISDFALVHGTFDGGDQGLLNLYFSDWATKDIAKHLPFVYNVVSCVTYSYLPALKQFRDKLKIIHFIGATKPWLQPFDTEAGLSRVSSDTLAQSQSDFIQLWWNIFCTSVHPSLSANMAGLAGALATVKLGSSLSEEHHALQDHLRRQGWEEGHVDYMGRDSFDNIWAKICETLSAGPSPVAASADLPAAAAAAAAETQASATTPPREVVRVEARRTSVPKAEKALETLFMKPNTMLQPTSEQADPLTPPPFLAQPQFTPAAAPAESKTDDAKLAETASLPAKVESESPACPLPQPESPAIAPKPESESPIPPKPQPETPVCPIPPKVESESPASPLPPQPTPQPESPACPLPTPEQTPAVPPPTQTPAVPPPAQTPAVPPPAQQTPAVPPPAQTPAVPPPAQTPAVPPPAQTPASPIEQTPAVPPPAQTPAVPSPAQIPAPVEGIPAATPLNEPSSVKAPETTPPSVVKSETAPPSQPTLPETPPQSPPQPSQPQPETPKTPVQSQPSTPTVTTATPPLSPPPVPSESAVEKLSVQVDIPQTPPVVDIPPPAAAASPVVPQESAASAVPPVVPQASAPSDEPPIPPKRKGGRGGGDQGKQGRGGGKGGRGKK